MKIFVDCHVFDKGFQGTRSYIQGLYLELIKDEKKHFFLAANDIENLKKTFGNPQNITYLNYKTKNPIFRLLIEIPMLIKKNKIDFAHFQYRVPPIKFCKYIVTTHDVLFEDFPEDFPVLNRLQCFYTYKYSAKISDVVFTVSEYSKRQIQKHLKIENPIVMCNGVDKEFSKPYDKVLIQNEVKNKYGISNYIIYISRWEPRKNHHLLLKYFVELELYKNHHLVLIGDDTFKNLEYENYYNNINQEAKDKIKTFKRVDFEMMLLFLRGAKVSVYPSRAEGFGIPPLESIAAQIPTIVSNRTAMSDFDFFEKYAFNPENANDFKRALIDSIDNPYNQMDYKKKCVNERYNWKLAATIFNTSITDF